MSEEAAPLSDKDEHGIDTKDLADRLGVFTPKVRLDVIALLCNTKDPISPNNVESMLGIAKHSARVCLEAFLETNLVSVVEKKDDPLDTTYVIDFEALKDRILDIGLLCNLHMSVKTNEEFHKLLEDANPEVKSGNAVD